MIGPNRSTAVMQRRAEAHDSLDDFPTPPWAGRALCEMLLQRGVPLERQSCWEPACNRGYLVRGLADYFDRVIASDVHDYGWEGMGWQGDFLLDWPEDLPAVDWIITNPPFRLADQFIRMGLSRARVGVAMLVRTAFDEGEGRYTDLFRDLPEAFAFPFVERVVMHRSALRRAGQKYWDPAANDGEGAVKSASTATAYQWLVWLTDVPEPETIKLRIPPCRLRLERDGDYPPPEPLPGDSGGLFPDPEMECIR